MHMNFCADLFRNLVYGNDTLDYNVHGLFHLAQDVRWFGPLESFSAFSFESFLNRIKNWKPSHPLQ